jgi:hypothetical protein
MVVFLLNQRVFKCFNLIMEKIAEPKHIPHKDKKIAYHMDWEFRKEAAIWIDEKPVLPNFYPLATDLRNWLLQQGDLKFFPPSDKKLSPSYSNPYTYDGSILAITFSQIINDSALFISGKEEIDAFKAEIRRIRFYTEQVLYIARLCEAFIKQLLFCTTFPEGEYRGSALGALLSKDCNGCKGSKEKRHKLSLLGSLAHRYNFCDGYEKCLNEHMTIVNRRRDVEAAHSGITEFTEKKVSVIRKQLGDDTSKIGDNFVHMLGHISDVEQRMLTEFGLMIVTEARRIQSKQRT